MAGNQREMRKKELKAKKDRKNKTIIWIIIAIVVAVLIVMKVCEININTVKEHFTDSSGKLSISQNVEKNKKQTKEYENLLRINNQKHRLNM